MKQTLPYMTSARFVDIISYLFVLLFTYAAFSKLFEFEEFKAQLSQSPMLTEFSDPIAVGIPLLEILISLLLLDRHRRLYGLYASYGLMFIFTLYIITVLSFSPQVPCSCGGILEKMGWTAHIYFNLIFILLALWAILYTKKSSEDLGALASR